MHHAGYYGDANQGLFVRVPNKIFKNKYFLLAMMDILGNINYCTFSYPKEQRMEIKYEISVIKSQIQEALVNAISIQETYFLISDNQWTYFTGLQQPTYSYETDIRYSFGKISEHTVLYTDIIDFSLAEFYYQTSTEKIGTVIYPLG